MSSEQIVSVVNSKRFFLYSFATSSGYFHSCLFLPPPHHLFIPPFSFLTRSFLSSSQSNCTEKNPLKCLLAFLLNNRLAQNISHLFIQSLSLILPLTLIDNPSSANAHSRRTTVRNGLQEQFPSHKHSRKIKCNQALVLCQAKCDLKEIKPLLISEIILFFIFFFLFFCFLLLLFSICPPESPCP